MVTGMTDAEPDKRLEVVLAESLRALAHQQSLLDNLRSRATLLTTAAALVSNDRRIRTLQWWFTAGLALLFVEVVGWIAEVTAAWGSA